MDLLEIIFFMIACAFVALYSYNKGRQTTKFRYNLSLVEKIEHLDKYAMVREFTEGAFGPMPDTPRLMSQDEILHIVRMNLSELTELLQTLNHYTTPIVHELIESEYQFPRRVDTVKLLTRLASETPYPKEKALDDLDTAIAEQADALVDIMYYNYDMAVRCGIDLEPCFYNVHLSNLRKRRPDPNTGEIKYIIKDNKIQKPSDWVDNNMTDVIKALKNRKNPYDIS